MSNKKIIEELNAMEKELAAFMSRWNYKATRLKNMLGAKEPAKTEKDKLHDYIAEAGAKRRMKILNR